MWNQPFLLKLQINKMETVEPVFNFIRIYNKRHPADDVRYIHLNDVAVL
jgi:hypothetical protein